MSLFTVAIFLLSTNSIAQQKRAADYGIQFGQLPKGQYNAITDVAGVNVGHTTIIISDSVRTGVTAILPHSGNIYQQKVPAAVYVGNGFGKLAGSTQVVELGNLETPIVLTNTLSVPTAMQTVLKYTLSQIGNDNVRSVNAVVGETNDGLLNDIRGMHITEQHVWEAIQSADDGIVKEGNTGAGTGTVCFGFKGGIGTSSRMVTIDNKTYTVGVLVQTNFGGSLTIAGVPVGRMLEGEKKKLAPNSADGSCMMVVATDAPLDSRNLERLAKRAMLGLARTGGIASNGSGDYVIAFSTYAGNRIPHSPTTATQSFTTLHNDSVTPLFVAAIDATEEAIINSLFAAETMKGRGGREVRALPVEEVLRMMREYRALQ